MAEEFGATEASLEFKITQLFSSIYFQQMVREGSQIMRSERRQGMKEFSHLKNAVYFE